MVQALFGLFCAWRLVAALRTRLRFGDGAWLTLFVVATAPQWQWARNALPESLAFSTFLWFMALVVDTLTAPTPRGLAALGALAGLAVHLRPQYLFLYPPLALVLAGLLFRSRFARASVVAVLASVLAIAGVHVTQRAYNAAVHHSLDAITMTGIQLLTVQVYLMQPGDVDVIADPADRRYLESVLQVVDVRTSVAREACDVSDPFGDVYNAICWGSIVTTFGIPPTAEGRAVAAPWVALDRMTTRIALELIRAHPLRYLVHAARSIYRSERYMAALILLEIVAGTMLALQTRRLSWLVLALFGLFAASNLVLVALVEVVLMRYSYPTDTVALMAAAALWCAHPETTAAGSA